MRSVEVRSHKKDAAVSPVVGVMLMLVVTIVIAAVVAMFATGVFSETKAASTAVISLDNDKIVKNDDNVYLTTMQFSHKGGDKLNVNELTLLVTYNGATASNPFSTVANNTTTWSVGEKIGVGAQSSDTDKKNLAPGYLTSDPSYYTWSITDGSGLVIASGTRYFDVDKAETQTVFVSSDTLAKANVVIENNTAAAGETVYVYSNKKFVTGKATVGSSETEITVDSSGYWGYFTKTGGESATVSLVLEGTTTTVTLDGNGAESPSEDQHITLAYGSDVVSSIDTPSKTDYTFGGWTITEDGSDVVIDTSGYLVPDMEGWTDEDGKWINTNDTATLYAKWTVESWSLFFEAPDNHYVKKNDEDPTDSLFISGIPTGTEIEENQNTHVVTIKTTPSITVTPIVSSGSTFGKWKNLPSVVEHTSYFDIEFTVQ